jgi:hypothetical protein
MDNKTRKIFAAAWITFVVYALCAMYIMPIDPDGGDRFFCVFFGLISVGLSALIAGPGIDC